MMTTSLLLRAWVIQMRRCAVIPRVLADDLQLLCTGENHLKIFEYGFTQTHKHIHDLGAKLAPKKSTTFSSDEASRQWLRNHKHTSNGFECLYGLRKICRSAVGT